MLSRTKTLAIAALLFVGVVVSAAPSAAGGGTVIAGRITAPDGSPISNGRVDIVYSSAVPCSAAQAWAWTFTDSDGYYSMGTTSDSTQAKLRFMSFSDSTATEWWPDKPTCSSAGWVDVSGGGTVTIDVVLSEAEISGVVRDAASGSGLMGVEVVAYAEPYPDPSLPVMHTAETDFHGRYEFGPLPPGDWRIRAKDRSAPITHAQQWYGGSLSPDNATAVTVTDTSDLTVDFSLVPGNKITTDVEAIRGPEIDGDDVCLDAFEVGESVPVGSWTGGRQYLVLPVGDYQFRVKVCEIPRRYGTVWYGGTNDRANAEVIEIRAGAEYLDIEISMSTRCMGEWPTILGTDLDDILTGTNQPDVIVAGDGDDEVWALGSGDLVCLDRGNDWADGGPGVDVIDGGPGNDFLVGGRLSDHLMGRWGRDTLEGGLGNDILDGGPGRDTVSYRHAVAAIVANLGWGTVRGEGRDTVTETENVIGTPFADRIVGDASDNTLRGFGGDDVIRGQAGDDRIFGGRGDDTLNGGDGFDLLDGGSGTNVCFFGEDLTDC